jgi:4-diphosphocytidyl-2-C-methyl-D-erythritol kinase
MSVTVRVPAKINLRLGVGPVRADGFHPLDTVYQAIGLYDDLTATDAEEYAEKYDGSGEWSIHTIADAHVDLSTVPDDADNLAVRAGQALAKHHGIERAAHLEVRKGIPVAGGLAGGSADAAAALVALDRLWDLQTSDEDLLALAAELGSDVPFALIGGTARGTGRGELVEPVPDLSSLWWVVVPHPVGLSTPAVYRQYDALADRGEIAAADPVAPDDLLAALVGGDAGAVARALGNDLQAAAYSLRLDLAERHDQLNELDTLAVLLSGSGPTQLLLHDSGDAARATAHSLTEMGIGHVIAPAPVAGATVISYA